MMHRTLAGIGLLIATLAQAQAGSIPYPKAAQAFLDAELPQMQAAIDKRDARYFTDANMRVQKFTERWGVEMGRTPSCTDAVTQFLAIGMCKVSAGKSCEPPAFQRNLADCKATADAAK